MRRSTGLKPGELPRGGIEVQMLDHGYRQQYEKKTAASRATGSPPTATSSPSALRR